MSKKYRQEADVQLIPYYEYDPSIHNVEYRYIPTEADQEFQDFSGTFNYDYDSNNDWWRRPRPRPFFGPFAGPFGFPVPFGGYPYGGYPYGGGWHGYPHGGWHHGSGWHHPGGGWGGHHGGR